MATIKYWDGSAWQYAVVGKQGPVGPTGPTGPVGATGATGATGPSALTTKGDIATFSTTTTRLAVGANGETLVADSSTTTGLRWQGDWNTGKNKIINGDFFINQRGFTSASNTGGFKFDRWDVSSFNTGTITDSSQTFTPGAAPVAGYEGATFFRVVTATGAGAGNYYFLRQKIEDVRTLAGQTATISFWAKAGSGTPKIAIEISQNFGSGGSPSAAVDTYVGQVTLSTSWTRYSATVSVPSLTGKTIGTTANSSSLQLNLWVTAGANYNARTGSLGIQDATFDIWGVQVEAGSVATPFTTATGTLAGELAACQRYFIRYSADNLTQRHLGQGNWYSTTNFYPSVHFPAQMRTYPVLTASAGNILTIYYNGTNRGSTAIAIDSANDKCVVLNVTSSTGTAGNGGLINIAVANATLDFSAEL